jgi:hypothetical protein
MARRGITYGTRNAEIEPDGQIIELKDKPVGGEYFFAPCISFFKNL